MNDCPRQNPAYRPAPLIAESPPWRVFCYQWGMYEQDGPSLVHLHVATQTRGSASASMRKMNHPWFTFMSLRRRVGLLRSCTRCRSRWRVPAPGIHFEVGVWLLIYKERTSECGSEPCSRLTHRHPRVNKHGVNGLVNREQGSLPQQRLAPTVGICRGARRKYRSPPACTLFNKTKQLHSISRMLSFERHFTLFQLNISPCPA